MERNMEKKKETAPDMSVEKNEPSNPSDNGNGTT